MPKVWLAWSEDSVDVHIFLYQPPGYTDEEVVMLEMNNSLYRQIEAVSTKHYKFQDAMKQWFIDAEAGRLKRISDGR